MATRGKGLYPITREIVKWVALTAVKNGLLTVFIQHTSASLVIQENADPDVTLDLAAFFEEMVPESGPYLHTTEDPDDMPAHIRAALTQTNLSIPIIADVQRWEHGKAFMFSSTEPGVLSETWCCR